LEFEPGNRNGLFFPWILGFLVLNIYPLIKAGVFVLAPKQLKSAPPSLFEILKLPLNFKYNDSMESCSASVVSGGAPGKVELEVRCGGSAV